MPSGNQNPSGSSGNPNGAAPTVRLSVSNNGSTVYGQPVTLVATVTGAGTPTGTVSFFDGATAVGTAPVDGAGQATMTASGLPVGADSITADYSGDSNFMSATSAPASVTVARAATQIVLMPQPVLANKNKLVSIGLDATVKPVAPGGGIPMGTVTFLVKQKKKMKTLGTVTLVGGEATLTLKAGRVLHKAITLVYSGDADETASTATPRVVTRNSLVSLNRPMVAMFERSSLHRHGNHRHGA